MNVTVVVATFAALSAVSAEEPIARFGIISDSHILVGDHDSVTFVVRPLNAWGVAGGAIKSESVAHDNAGARCWY